MKRAPAKPSSSTIIFIQLEWYLILMVGTIRSARVVAVPIQTNGPSPTSWGELFFYKEFSALPKPSYPAP